MTFFTVFDPLTRKIISWKVCSHHDDIPSQMNPGEGVVLGHKDADWQWGGSEGFIRNHDGTFTSVVPFIDL